MERKRLKTQQEITFEGLDEAIAEYIRARRFYFALIMRAEVDAEVLATEWYACVASKLGFKKYLN